MLCHNIQRIESLYFCRAPSEKSQGKLIKGKVWKDLDKSEKEELKVHEYKWDNLINI